MNAAERRLVQLLEALRASRRLLILTHDNPDPDALASGWALRTLVRRTLDLRAELAYGGIIGRAENREMMRRLRIPALPFAKLPLPCERYDAVALVDSQPGGGNHSLAPGRAPDVVIDHHPPRRGARGAAFQDVRPHYGASATMLHEYLEAAGIDPERRLVTALFYAIRSETQNLGRECGGADARAFVALFPRVSNRLIARIEQAPFSREYLNLLSRALRATRLHARVAVAQLGALPYPDAPAELGDLLLRVQPVRWVLVSGRHGARVHFSLRTADRRANAGRLASRLVGDLGAAGGHESMAGGHVDLRATRLSAACVQQRLSRRFRELLGVPGGRGEPLLPGRAVRHHGV